MIVCGKFYGLICHKLTWHTEIGKCKIKVLHVIRIKYALEQNLDTVHQVLFFRYPFETLSEKESLIK